MSTPAPALEHLRELAERKSKAYRLLLALEQNPSADESCFQSLARVIDRVQFNEVSLDEAALGSLDAFVSSNAPDLASTLAVLDVASSEAEPDRAGLQLLLAHFAGWLKLASGDARPVLLEILPNIAALFKELGNAGVETLIACLNSCSWQRESDLMARTIVRYQETSGQIMVAAAVIARRLIQTTVSELVERMLIAVPPEAMLDSKDARSLLPALAQLQIADSGESLASAATAVCLTVATQNHSSALNLARQLPQAAASLPHESRLPYLRSFAEVVENAGVSMLGYGTKDLPALFRKAGPERASAFVAQGAGIARNLGKIAAQEFFEQKTAAAKKAASAA